MTPETTYPMTLGQLSVWRDIERMHPEKWWEGNLCFSWSLPENVTAVDVWRAVGALGMRHASLRTTFDVEDRADPRQRVAVDSPDDVVAAVRQPDGETGMSRIETEEIQRAFTLTTDLPWRVWLTENDGRPRELLVVIHHMAADGAGINTMERDFYALLAGETLPPAPQPADLATRQRSGDLDARLLAAESYWRKVLSAAPRRTPPAPGPVLRATMHTGIPEPILRQAARGIGVTVAGVLLTAYCRAIIATGTTGTPVLLYPMSSNRFDPAVTSLVTSMNQWVPLLATPEPDEVFAHTARALYVRNMRALKHGVYDPDAVARIREDAEREGGPLDPGYHFTFLLPPMVVQPPETIQESRIEWHVPIRSTGPGFYLMANADTTVRLTVRVIREGYQRAELEALLVAMRDDLMELVGAHAEAAG
ncbi:condensation domain-containing protein [Micromonospora sp. NPDC049114]|uniref:condensation domain-containing protein n=1 Tax=unclassified Micromonospora TaxID=2617518 RepID=UPI0034019B1A